MNARKLKKAILAEALRLYAESGRFPVRRFMLNLDTGECDHHEYEREFGWLDELMQLCRELRNKG